jgi:hypothetical protein
VRQGVLVAGAAALALVPVLVLHGQSTSGHPHGDLQIDCGECHSPEAWVPVRRTPAFPHESTGFVLEATHEQVSCLGCHHSLIFSHVGSACVDCHRDSHRGELGTQCDACHTPTVWTNQREMFQVHNRTRFPLFVTHARLDCTACHRNQRPYQYANTPAECGNCHLSTYLQTTNPNHARLGLSRRCEDCHIVTSLTWQGASTAGFPHPETFPLTGGHAGLSCGRCHTGDQYEGLSRACFSCHQQDFAAATNPTHLGGRIPTTCDDCHTIAAWRPATFDHDLSRFPLTGAHTRVDCARCHTDGRYTGTPSDCHSCHQNDYAGTTDPNHQAAGFPTRCQDCHNTRAWRPASFDHDGRYFPIYSGNHRGEWSICADCHVNPGSFRAFECILCHEHSNRAEVDQDHEDVPEYTYRSAACYRCHPTGVKPNAFHRPRRLPRSRP